MAVNPKMDAFRIQGTGLVDCGVLLTLVTLQTNEEYGQVLGIYGAQVNSYKAKDSAPLASVGGIVNLDFPAS